MDLDIGIDRTRRRGIREVDTLQKLIHARLQRNPVAQVIKW